MATPNLLLTEQIAEILRNEIPEAATERAVSTGDKSVSEIESQLNEALINIQGVADVLRAMADEDGGKRDGPWNVFMMLRNTLNTTAAEIIEAIEGLSKLEKVHATAQVDRDSP